MAESIKTNTQNPTLNLSHLLNLSPEIKWGQSSPEAIKLAFLPCHPFNLLIGVQGNQLTLLEIAVDPLNPIKYTEQVQLRWPKTNIVWDQSVIEFVYPNLLNGSSIPVSLCGTKFQQKVWSALARIPMGSVANYSDLAKQMNNPNASRAIGSAIGKNPLAVLIPCHRVVRKNGDLGGYRWGLEAKSHLLDLEAKSAPLPIAV